MRRKNETTAEYNERKRVDMSERYHRVRCAMIRQLGGICVRCGISKDLQIDHIDPKQKTMGVTRMTCVSESRRQQELANCQLLCGRCHTAKTVTEDLGRQFVSHGTFSMYQRYNCRCDDCKAAYSIMNREYKRRRKARVRNSTVE